MITGKTVGNLGKFLLVIAVTIILSAIWAINTEMDNVVRLVLKLSVPPVVEIIGGIIYYLLKYKKYNDEFE